MTRLPFRAFAALGLAVCLSGMLFALYLQHFRGFEPCPLCVFQRVAMIATGLVFLVAALHGPRGIAGRWAYGGLAGLAAAAGIFTAARHVWLQNLPPDQVPSCGPTLDYLAEMLPFTEMVQTVLKGDGNCAIIDAQWLGLSLPTWTLVAFIGLALWALAMPLAARKESP